MKPLIELKNISKYFGMSRALQEMNLEIFEGECLGIIGHNGAGKSTLVNILTGSYPQTSGELFIDGELQPSNYDIFISNKLGIRNVFQELSLCPNLTVIENMRVFHPVISGVGWKKRAEKLIMDQLDEIFPDHGISSHISISKLSLGQRQMIEIAKAFTSPEGPLRLVILDEPTSALGNKSTQQLIDYLDTLRERKLSVIYISHMLEEVIASTDRIMVMKDGIRVNVVHTSETDREQIIQMMGSETVSENKGVDRNHAKEGDEPEETSPLVVEPLIQNNEVQITVRKGEVIGLTGLAGHGQTQLLLDLFDPGRSGRYKVSEAVTFLPGDRQTDGVFPIWSITKNLTIQAYTKARNRFLIDRRKEKQFAEKWKKTIDIKAVSLDDQILSLSGGNQQKVLFSRCLESPAQIVLMDDPTRGVDIGTKLAIYKLILKEKSEGRSFIWYTTEMDELNYCDRLYVFKGGRIITELHVGDASEEDILKASF